MKKIVLALTTIILAMLFMACSKAAFDKQRPTENMALIYVYTAADTNKVSFYTIGVNGKKMEGGLKTGEYKMYNLKPGIMSIAAYKGENQEEKVDLDLGAGKTYYLRVKSFSNDSAKFEIKRVNSSVAYEELTHTVLAEDNTQSDGMISELFTSREEAIAPIQNSKTKALQNATDLKEQGILNEDEFNKLKEKILSK
jgi:hypothetical protein